MYFDYDDKCFRANDGEDLKEFFIKLLDEQHRSKCLVSGCYDNIYVICDSDSTVESLKTSWFTAKEKENNINIKAPEPNRICAETVTMVKIEDVLIQSGLEYWTFYNPEDGTHIIKFGKDLNLDD